mmetsp:Transcript_7970/g.23347  ORF Transcript_7970/g.23347 Transcript_7970/m.23347 type:complete len:213 (-) Transcript_7970:531-1169(-)
MPTQWHASATRALIGASSSSRGMASQRSSWSASTSRSAYSSPWTSRPRHASTAPRTTPRAGTTTSSPRTRWTGRRASTLARRTATSTAWALMASTSGRMRALGSRTLSPLAAPTTPRRTAWPSCSSRQWLRGWACRRTILRAPSTGTRATCASTITPSARSQTSTSASARTRTRAPSRSSPRAPSRACRYSTVANGTTWLPWRAPSSSTRGT